MLASKPAYEALKNFLCLHIGHSCFNLLTFVILIPDNFRNSNE